MARHDDPVGRTRRFYKSVDVAERDGDLVVRLDGRLPRSPEGRPLALPTPGLAELVAEEWAAQGEYILPPSMPATRLAWTVIDRAEAVRSELAAEVARFAGSDLLCYFAEGPEALVRRQEQNWTPLIAWAGDSLSLEFRRVHGIVHQPQPEAMLERCRDLAAQTDDFSLTGLAFGAALFGSAILAFALQRGRIDGLAAFALSRLDETFQEERWGVDAEAAERAETLARDAQMLEGWFAALR